MICTKGIRFNYNNLPGLCNCEEPINAGKLCEYMHGLSWVSLSIPRFAESFPRLRELLEEKYLEAGRGAQKKNSIRNFASTIFAGARKA